MHLNDQISELLYHYDCVIIPEFGGFITNYKPATLDSRLHIFHPPSKEVSFNRNLVKNDGLLANFLSENSACTFEEANALIKKQVEHYFSELNDGKRITFKKVGIIYRDTDRNMRFQPTHEVNFLKDSFGLEQLFAMPVSKPGQAPEKTVEIEKPQPEETPVIAIDQPTAAETIRTESDAEEKHPSRRWIWAAAIALPFIAYGGWLLSSADLSQPANLSIADLNPFAPKEIPVHKARTAPFEWHEEPEAQNDIEALLQSDKEVVHIAFSEEDTASIAVRLKEPVATVAIPVNTYVATPEILAMRYHVVGGCFSELQNAHNLVDSLRAKGYAAYILDQHKGLYRVTFGNFTRRKEALEVLAEVKSSEMQGAWLLVK